jgi:AhpD family alkylhydroperoxidase
VPGKAEQFRKDREIMNEKLLAAGSKTIQRFFALDMAAYRKGALPAKTKELIGLAASMVLRCDDCITYHILRCAEEGVAKDEILEAMEIGLIVGGSIVIPHLRRAYALLGEVGVA